MTILMRIYHVLNLCVRIAVFALAALAEEIKLYWTTPDPYAVKLSKKMLASTVVLVLLTFLIIGGPLLLMGIEVYADPAKFAALPQEVATK